MKKPAVSVTLCADHAQRMLDEKAVELYGRKYAACTDTQKTRARRESADWASRFVRELLRASG